MSRKTWVGSSYRAGSDADRVRAGPDNRIPSTLQKKERGRGVVKTGVCVLLHLPLPVDLRGNYSAHPGMAGLSLRCGDCGAHLKSVEEAQEHAELTSHTNFSESTEAVLNLVCTACGKPCRTKIVCEIFNLSLSLSLCVGVYLVLAPHRSASG